MKPLFPSKHEQLITAVLIAFTTGTLAGFSTVTLDADASSLLPAIAALAAAFLGAWTAFHLENKSRSLQKRQEQLDAANSLLYSLFEQLNIMKLFQIDHIDPHRNNPARMITMRPVLDLCSPNAKLNAEKVPYLVQTNHRHLLFTIHVMNEKFFQAIRFIEHRNVLHLKYQEAMNKVQFAAGDQVSDRDVKLAMGPMSYEMLQQATDVVIGHVDIFVERADELRASLIKAFSEIFSPQEIFNFEMLDKPTTKIK